MIVPRLARSPNAVWRELNVNMRSVKEVKCRLTIEGAQCKLERLIRCIYAEVMYLRRSADFAMLTRCMDHAMQHELSHF